METIQAKQELLSQIPSVHDVLETPAVQRWFNLLGRKVVTDLVREHLNTVRETILADGDPPGEQWTSRLREDLQELLQRQALQTLRSVVNGTGVVIHTNLGRSVLSERALENIQAVARHYSNLEYDLYEGKRGSRIDRLERLLCSLTGAEAAMVVNNNAAAVLLVLSEIASGREVIVSRGELVEIGGSFRIPDVMRQSGAVLVEVGTTNKTHPRDYKQALTERTAALMKVHTSNYRVVGFSGDVDRGSLATLAHNDGLPVIEDLGSGSLVTLTNPELAAEPTVESSVAAGVDVVTFSGDKILGGPQAGLIVGRQSYLERLRRHPLARALRVDKMTIAALEATLQLYLDPEQALREIPTLRVLNTDEAQLVERARRLAGDVEQIDTAVQTRVVEETSRVGGGALPLTELPSRSVQIQVDGWSAEQLAVHLERGDPPVVGRRSGERFRLDVRTLVHGDHERIVTALRQLLQRERGGQR